MDRLRPRVRAAGDYLSTTKALALLVWRAGSRLVPASVALSVVGGILPAADIVIVSALLQTLVNAGSPGRAAGTRAGPHFLLLLVLLIAVTLLIQVTQGLTQLTIQLLGTRISNHVQLLIAAQAASVDLASMEDRAFHDEMQTAANEGRYRPVQVVIQFMSSLSTLATLASLIVILITWHVWAVGALLVASGATLWVSTHFGSEKVALATARAETERGKHYLYNLLVSDQGAKEIRLFSLRDLLVGRFRGVLSSLYGQDRRLAWRQLAYSLPASLMLAATQIALITVAAVQAWHGSIAVGRFNQYMLTIVQLGAQLPLLAYSLGALHQGNLFASRLFSFLATQPQVEGTHDQAAPDQSAPDQSAPDQAAPGRAAAWPLPAGPHIVFEHVAFAYPGTDRQVLTDVSFEVRAGQTVALVGGNGSGKSTIVKLLAGLYEPSRGSVALNGADLRTLDRVLLRNELSVVFQDFNVYHLSARDNVGLGQPSYLDDDERIAAAAHESGLDRVIARLPDGFDTVLSRFWSKGHELSGGQRQLVALARALLRQAPVLILDEPSSALDAQAEADFFGRLLDGAGPGPSRCVIFSSHRLSAARRVDQILVLKDGRIAERGSHDQLVAANGVYAQMFRWQARAYEDPGGRAQAASSAPESRAWS